MPEGDTLHKIAGFMHPRLAGKPLVQVVAARSRLPELEGGVVRRVYAAGKHLLVELPDWVLRVHLGMHGAWHRYAPGEAWRKPRGQVSVQLHTQDEVFVCFNAQDVECLRPHEMGRSAVARLGPNLLNAHCDMAEVLRRALAQPASTCLADLLLDQRVAAGLGNVFKCELLFMHRLHPLTPRGRVDAAALERLYATGQVQLRNNTGGWRRTTTYDASAGLQVGKPRLYVYGRKELPCWECQTPIAKAVLGETRRVTYWCPRCQSSGAPAVV